MLADELSRFTVPLSTTLDPTAQLTIPWRDLLCSSGIQVTQVGRKWPSNFDIRLREKRLLQSADWVPPSISLWGVLTPAGRLSIRFGALGAPHHFIDLNIPRHLGCGSVFGWGYLFVGLAVQNWTRWFFWYVQG